MIELFTKTNVIQIIKLQEKLKDWEELFQKVIPANLCIATMKKQ